MLDHLKQLQRPMSDYCYRKEPLKTGTVPVLITYHHIYHSKSKQSLHTILFHLCLTLQVRVSIYPIIASILIQPYLYRYQLTTTSWDQTKKVNTKSPHYVPFPIQILTLFVVLHSIFSGPGTPGIQPDYGPYFSICLFMLLNAGLYFGQAYIFFIFCTLCPIYGIWHRFIFSFYLRST